MNDTGNTSYRIRSREWHILAQDFIERERIVKACLKMSSLQRAIVHSFKRYTTLHNANVRQ